MRSVTFDAVNTSLFFNVSFTVLKANSQPLEHITNAVVTYEGPFDVDGVIADEAGSYRFQQLTPGDSYTFRISVPGYCSDYVYNVISLDDHVNVVVSMTPAATPPGNTEDGTDGGASAFGQLIYAPVLPFTRTEDGAQSASPDSVLAIRLRAAEGIVPESILATVPEGLEDRASVEWMPAGGDGGNDVWVLFRPEDQWGEGEIFSLSTSASTTADAPLNSATYVSRAGAGDAEAAGPLWQPRAGEDYDATGLDAAYIGFLVRHAAIVQVRGPAE